MPVAMYHPLVCTRKGSTFLLGIFYTLLLGSLGTLQSVFHKMPKKLGLDGSHQQILLWLMCFFKHFFHRRCATLPSPFALSQLSVCHFQSVGYKSRLRKKCSTLTNLPFFFEQQSHSNLMILWLVNEAFFRILFYAYHLVCWAILAWTQIKPQSRKLHCQTVSSLDSVANQSSKQPQKIGCDTTLKSQKRNTFGLMAHQRALCASISSVPIIYLNANGAWLDAFGFEATGQEKTIKS